MSKLLHKVLLAVFILTLALSLMLPLSAVSTQSTWLHSQPAGEQFVATSSQSHLFFTEVAFAFPVKPDPGATLYSYTWAG